MTNAKARYENLATKRDPYLRRARDAARLTIPSLYPPEGSTGSTNLPTPYQGIGAKGVNNLSSKLVLTLLPPNSPFFRLMVANKIKIDEKALSDVEEALSKVESQIMDETESLTLRSSLNEAAKHLVVAGNVLLRLTNDGLKVFHLDRYVVRRDAMGVPLEIVVKESVAPSTLSADILAACEVAQWVVEKNENVDLYTHLVRINNTWIIGQELNAHFVPGSEGTYPLDTCPWMALRWSKIDSEDYGRGYVEEYMGDLISCEELSKAIVQGAAAAAKVVFMVDPNGTVKIRTLTKAENLDVIQGRATDVTVLQLAKFADFQVAANTLDKLESRLAHAFLLNSAIQRNGERVTAEEIRFMAGELEDALGGIYSLLTQELQRPLVQNLMAMMNKAGKLPHLPKDTVKLVIITGLEALGRNHDLEKLRVFLNYLQPLGPEVIAEYVNVDDYVKRVATALGMNTKGLVRTTEEIQSNQQNSQMMAMVQQFAPEIFKAMMTNNQANKSQ